MSEGEKDRVFDFGGPAEFSVENMRLEAIKPPETVFSGNDGVFIGFDESSRPSLDSVFASMGRMGGPSRAGWHSWEEAMRCPRADYFLRKERVALSSPSLEIGAILHEFMAMHYTEHSQGIDPSTKIEALSTALLNAGYGESYNKARQLYDHYNVQYPSETDEFLRHFTVVDVEREFERMLPWGEAYTGRADLVLKHPSGGYVIVDHKTSAREDSDFLEGWVLDPQMLGLAWCVSKTLKPIQGYMINGIIKRTKPGFRRMFFSVDIRLIKDWLTMMKYWSVQRRLSDMAGHPPNFSLCIRRYGRCQFFERCAFGMRG